MIPTSNSTKSTALISVLTRDVNHLTLIGLLAILVIVLHGITVFWLVQPIQRVKEDKPRKLVEVVLLAKPVVKPELKIKPKPEPKPPKPKPPKLKPKLEPKPKIIPPPVALKKTLPKVKAGKPLVKDKAPEPIKQTAVQKPAPVRKPVVYTKTQPDMHKTVESVKPQVSAHKTAESARVSPVLTSKSVVHSAQPAFSSANSKPSRPAPLASTGSIAKSGVKPAEKNGSGGHDKNDSACIALSEVIPKYPMRAKSRNIEGWVKVSLTVTVTGSVINAQVAGSSPTGIFDSAALEAIQKFRFKPKVVNGIAVNCSATKKFNFNLN